MSLKDQISSDIGIFLNLSEFAKEIIYLAQASQQEIIIKAIVDFGEDLKIGSPDVAEFGQMLISKNDISEPKNMDTVIIDNKHFRVDKIISCDDYIYDIQIRRKESVVL